MADLRDVLAVVLGILVGIVLIVAPRTALRASVFVGPQRRRRGDYGTDDVVPEMWVWGARVIGVACVGIAVYIAVSVLA